MYRYWCRLLCLQKNQPAECFGKSVHHNNAAETEAVCEQRRVRGGNLQHDSWPQNVQNRTRFYTLTSVPLNGPLTVSGRRDCGKYSGHYGIPEKLAQLLGKNRDMFVNGNSGVRANRGV